MPEGNPLTTCVEIRPVTGILAADHARRDASTGRASADRRHRRWVGLFSEWLPVGLSLWNSTRGFGELLSRMWEVKRCDVEKRRVSTPGGGHDCRDLLVADELRRQLHAPGFPSGQAGYRPSLTPIWTSESPSLSLSPISLERISGTASPQPLSKDSEGGRNLGPLFVDLGEDGGRVGADAANYSPNTPPPLGFNF